MKKAGCGKNAKVVCLCGSTKFQNYFTAINEQLTLQGYIVLAPGVFAHSTGRMLTLEEKAKLDNLHLWKIDMADLVYVVNPDDYIGLSTWREIEYAKENGKKLVFLEKCRRFPHAKVMRINE